MSNVRYYTDQMLNQLGGNTFLMMTGAKLTHCTGKDVKDDSCLAALAISLADKSENSFNIHNITKVEMCLMYDDTYTFKFYSGSNSILLHKCENVYFDEVKDVFERETNLLVTMFNRVGSSVVVGKDVI